MFATRRVDLFLRQGSCKDPRSRLQELTQRDLGATPIYDVIDRAGPAHAPTFEVTVTVAGRVLAHGRGTSKREAARRAAEVALEAQGTDGGQP